MNLGIVQVTPEQWRTMSEPAHFAVFNELRPADMDRIDYVLLGVDHDQDRPIGYISVREISKEGVFWLYGGPLPPIKETIYSFRLYQEMIDWTFRRYQRIVTLIQNDNASYLKMAAKVGFKIIGCRTFDGDVMLEHLLEKGN